MSAESIFHINKSLLNLQIYVHKLRIKMLPSPFNNNLINLPFRKSFFIYSLRTQRIIYIGKSDYAGLQRDISAGKSFKISGSIPFS